MFAWTPEAKQQVAALAGFQPYSHPLRTKVEAECTKHISQTPNIHSVSQGLDKQCEHPLPQKYSFDTLNHPQKIGTGWSKFKTPLAIFGILKRKHIIYYTTQTMNQLLEAIQFIQFLLPAYSTRQEHTITV